MKLRRTARIIAVQNRGFTKWKTEATHSISDRLRIRKV